MALPFSATVRLVNERYRHEGAHQGDIGVIVEVWGDRQYEVEVSSPANGETIALFTTAEQDLELFDRPNAEPIARSKE